MCIRDSRWLPGKVTDKVSPKMTYHFLSNQNILKVKVPLYHFHGTKDSVVPLKSGKKLFEVFEKEHPKIAKKFIEIKGGTHEDLIKYDAVSYTHLILDFMPKFRKP